MKFESKLAELEFHKQAIERDILRETTVSDLFSMLSVAVDAIKEQDVRLKAAEKEVREIGRSHPK